MFDREIHFRSMLAFLLVVLVMGGILRFILPARDFIIATLLPPYVGTVRIWESGAAALSRINGDSTVESTVVSLGARVAELEARHRLDTQLLEQFYSVPNSKDAIPARIIDTRADATGNQAALTYDIGADVQVGDLIVNQGILIGIIERAGKGIATLAYTFAPLNERSATLISQNTSVILYGKGGGFYGAEILREVQISEGDILVDSERQDIVIGEIVSIDQSPARPFSEALIRAPITISTLYEVLILPHDR